MTFRASAAERSVVQFARAALAAAHGVLHAYRTPFSRRQFTQPQLLAILCLKSQYGWSLRATELLLQQDREIAAALGLREAPDHTTLYRFVGRLPPGELERALRAARAYARNHK
ncbi:MAG TPA: transposase [Candidatus Acidoferrales bacterium]|nr:transposase [Candidatus Acidoferrales bacterium]